jgi:hypothetical protein
MKGTTSGLPSRPADQSSIGVSLLGGCGRGGRSAAEALRLLSLQDQAVRRWRDVLLQEVAEPAQARGIIQRQAYRLYQQRREVTGGAGRRSVPKDYGVLLKTTERQRERNAQHFRRRSQQE